MDSLSLRLSLILVLVISYTSYAQDAWINSLPFHFHPSFAGNMAQTRVAAQTNIEIVKGNSDYQATNICNLVSLDKFVSKIHSGVGIEISNYNDYHNYGFVYDKDRLNFLEERIVLAPKFSFQGKYTLSPSLQVINRNGVARSTIYTMPPYSLGSGALLPTINQSHSIEKRYGEVIVNLGLLFNSKNFFIGATMAAMDKEYKNIEPKIYTRSNRYLGSGITGVTLRKSEGSNFSLTMVLYVQNYFSNKYSITPEDSINNSPTYYSNTNKKMDGFFTISAKYKKVIAGVNTNSRIMLGYESTKIRIMLTQYFENSQDINGVNLGIYNAQISFRYLW